MATFNYQPKYDNYSITLPMEQSFDVVASTKWMQENWHYSIVISMIYIAAIYLGQKIMDSRKPFALKWPLFCWNSGLAAFSILGFVRLLPEWWWAVSSNSFEYSICTCSQVEGISGFWTEKFVMSKILELGDTAFIILRKRPLIFLHWYHHITVLIYTWHAYKDHTASGRWFVWMNYGVHSFMYSYYAIRALNIRIPKFFAMLITLLQLIQMSIGIYIAATVYSIKTEGGEKQCQQKWNNLYFSFIIYASYFCLFAKFFYQTYLSKNNVNEKQPMKKMEAINGASQKPKKKNVEAFNGAAGDMKKKKNV